MIILSTGRHHSEEQSSVEYVEYASHNDTSNLYLLLIGAPSCSFLTSEPDHNNDTNEEARNEAAKVTIGINGTTTIGESHEYAEEDYEDDHNYQAASDFW